MSIKLTRKEVKYSKGALEQLENLRRYRAYYFKEAAKYLSGLKLDDLKNLAIYILTKAKRRWGTCDPCWHVGQVEDAIRNYDFLQIF